MPSTTYVAHKRKHICATQDGVPTNAMAASAPQKDIRAFKTLNKLPVRANLVNFTKGPRGWRNNRDGPVLGSHPGMTIPDFGGCDVLLSFYLFHEINEHAMKTYLANYATPIFVDKMNQDADARLRFQHPVQSNEQWVSGKVQQVHWKKRKWGLSAHMRKLAGAKFPHWVVVATPRENGLLNYDKSVRSPAFEVRSKEQPRQTAFAAGRTVAKRRTPETFRAEQTLKSEQADILKLSDDLRTKQAQARECQARLKFALAIARSDASATHLVAEIEQYMRHHKM